MWMKLLPMRIHIAATLSARFRKSLTHYINTAVKRKIVLKIIIIIVVIVFAVFRIR